MLTLIGRRAKVSRPTIYKYVGDYAAIKRALMDRESLHYLVALHPVLARRLKPREHFRELVVFTVMYLRGNELLQTLLTAHPEAITPSLTVDLAPVLARGTAAAAALLQDFHPSLSETPVPVDIMIEWGIRISLSLITTPSPNTPLDTEAAIGAHVDALFEIVDVPVHQ
jgi:AcrR family transcriptional regulator